MSTSRPATETDPDPWGYLTSAYERAKYAATLAACGRGPFGSALELGASIGVFSALLAPRCRLADHDRRRPDRGGDRPPAARPIAQARAIQGTIPGEIPDGPFDLVVASEILYYLSPALSTRTLAQLARRQLPAHGSSPCTGAPQGPSARSSAATSTTSSARSPGCARSREADTDDYLLDVLERR